MALNRAGATDSINFVQDPDIVEQLKEMTGGRGPDAVIDAVGMEATHGNGLLHAADRVKQATRLETDRGHALRDAILACRPGGIVPAIGVYGGLLDKFPSGAFMEQGPHAQDRSVPGPALHAAALRTCSERRHRPEFVARPRAGSRSAGCRAGAVRVRLTGDHRPDGAR